jgi:protoporphyrinogen oxidase
MNKPHVVILGGGPAGAGAAYYLRQTDAATVTLLERGNVFGGNAGSFFANDQFLDYGSHRLHAACDPEILADITRLLAGDLTSRKRHGRIRLLGKWLHFPLRPIDLLLRLDKSFAFGAARDMVRRALFSGKAEKDTFAASLQVSLGPTICEHFYFPYARKIWGRDPEELSGIQARKRVSAGTFRSLLQRLAKPPGAGRFYYPRRGYGQITEAYATAAREHGAEMLLGWSCSELIRPQTADGAWTVNAEDAEGNARSIDADLVWSTIPITLAVGMMTPAAPAEVIAAAGNIEYRAMVLVYIELDVDQFTSTDAHYFPEEHISMTRLSEPKNYFGGAEPKGRTTLCAELPCAAGDEIWEMDDESRGRLVVEDMARAGLPLERPPLSAFSRRIAQAYPIYLNGYERPLEVLDQWANGLPGFLGYGRQGLFAHDNTHHALYMAHAASECLRGGTFDENKWTAYREVFATHTVED